MLGPGPVFVSAVMKKLGLMVSALLLLAGGAAIMPASLAQTENAPARLNPPGADIPDPYLAAWARLTADRTAKPLTAGVDYGMDPATGKFIWPLATPEVRGEHRFPGQLPYWDPKSYAKNVDVLGFYKSVNSPFQAWVNIADFGGHRYLYVHDRDYLRILDVTDPRHATTAYSSGPTWSAKGPSEAFDSKTVKNYFGGTTIGWSAKLGKPIMIASYEIGRTGLMSEKTKEPENVAAIRHYNSLKGFKVYAMNGPLPSQWELLATKTTDFTKPDAPIGEQRGSGSLDTPWYLGGKYMFLSASSDDSYVLNEVNYLYSPGYQVWDMSDPADPKFLSQITVPGQVVGDPASEEAYLMNPRAGNRASFMGSRMPPFVPKPIEKGGRLAFGAMGGLGFYVFDVADPVHPKTIGHVNTPPQSAGTEFDNADASQFLRTGYVFTNGYPLNKDCYEPFKDIYVIDAHDPRHPKVAATFPRPAPPPGAPFTDFCQRGGHFGPKRANAIGQPQDWRQNIIPYSFYNAGVQIYDVTNPAKPSIAGYFVPRMASEADLPRYTLGRGILGIFVEYDRNIIWAFAEDGAYALSSPLLGAPVLGPPPKPWPGKS